MHRFTLIQFASLNASLDWGVRMISLLESGLSQKAVLLISLHFGYGDLKDCRRSGPPISARLSHSRLHPPLEGATLSQPTAPPSDRRNVPIPLAVIDDSIDLKPRPLIRVSTIRDLTLLDSS